MRKYEVMFAVQPRIDEEAKKAVVDRFFQKVQKQ